MTLPIRGRRGARARTSPRNFREQASRFGSPYDPYQQKLWLPLRQLQYHVVRAVLQHMIL